MKEIMNWNCFKFKKGYFKYLHNCFACSLEDSNCKDCFFDESKYDKKILNVKM